MLKHREADIWQRFNLQGIPMSQIWTSLTITVKRQVIKTNPGLFATYIHCSRNEKPVTDIAFNIQGRHIFFVIKS